METSERTISKPPQNSEQKRYPNRRGLAFFVLSGVLVILITIASWVSDSRMTGLRWVPGWMGDWADRDPNIRTAIPFIPLAFLLTQGFAWRGHQWPVAWSVILCGACLGLSEIGQIFLPHRTADMADLMWGGIGILVGAVLAWGMSHWRRTARMIGGGV